MVEKGRWNGPAQVICHESRAIIWVTHLNRLLRCAHENLRPVSLREFQSHPLQESFRNSQQLQAMATKLSHNLQSRSGMFQYSDLSNIGDDDSPGNEVQHNPQGPQPEEEPVRNVPSGSDHAHAGVERAEDIPAPDSPAPSSISPSPSLAEEGVQADPSTASLETDRSDIESSTDLQPVYNAVILEGNGDIQNHLEDQDTLWENIDQHDEACVTMSFEMPKQQLQRFLQLPEQHLPCLAAAAKKGRSELTYSHLTAQERELFQQGKAKELKCWLDTNTVKAIARDKIHPDRILSSRWILTWKEDPSSSSGRKAKTRLVVKGFQDPNIDVLNSESPTLTRDARMLLMQTVSSLNWEIQAFDITTAFLRGKCENNRQLAMEPPKELKQLLGMEESQVCMLTGNAYGRVDAPLLFYREFRKHLEEVGFETHRLDNCLFLLRDKQDPTKLNGILGTHVDDGIGGGNNEFNRALDLLQRKLGFGNREYRKFKFTGLEVEQLPDFSIKVSQSKYVHQISPIDIPKSSRIQVHEKVTPTELHSLRGICGSLRYAAVHSRPDIAAKVAGLQKGINQATVETLLEANKAFKETQQTATTAIFVRPIRMTDVCFASFGDASFASAKQLAAQQGIFIMACTPKLARNETTEFSPIMWQTKQIGRVVRSTLSAEAYAMSSSLDKLTWIRCLWGYIKNPKFVWHKPEVALREKHSGLMITDCKSLFDLVTKTAVPSCQEWRTTIEVMLLKEQSKGHTQCRWISTAIMLADCLTKNMDSTFLRTVLQLGRFRIYDESHTS